MLGMTHVVLHLGLCTAALQQRPDASLPVSIRLVDQARRYPTTRVVTVPRGDETTVTVPFDSQSGIFSMDVSLPKENCHVDDFVRLIPDKNRLINEQLSDGPAPLVEPMLLEGALPQSFLYLQPEYVFFDKSTECNKPVGDPIPVHEIVENDQDSFYVWLYSDPATVAKAPLVMALQLQTATGEEHYIRLKVPFPSPWHGFPIDYQFSINEDVADGIATQPTGVLLCPRMTLTSGG
jgi:hypothetical protein